MAPSFDNLVEREDDYGYEDEEEDIDLSGLLLYPLESFK